MYSVLVAKRRGSNLNSQFGGENHITSSFTLYGTVASDESNIGLHYLAIGK